MSLIAFTVCYLALVIQSNKTVSFVAEIHKYFHWWWIGGGGVIRILIEK